MSAALDTLTPADERAAWLDWRRGGIGASDVAGILGLSPWASPWSVWADKVGLLSDREANEAMEAGHWLELAVGPWFAHKTGLYVAGEQMRCEHRAHPTHRCTLDGYVGETPGVSIDNTLGGLEIKHEAFGRRWDTVPAHYEAQGWWQMHVAGLERVWFAVLRGRTLDIHELTRDDAEIAFMVERVDAFWAEHVLTGLPPATDGHQATLDALAEVYPTGEPDSTVALDEIADTVRRWKSAKEAVKAAEAEEAEAAAEIKAALGDNADGTIGGVLAVSWRTQGRTGLDVKGLRSAHPDIAEQFTTTNSHRVMRSHKVKEAAR